MTTQTSDPAVHSTFVLERSYPQPPARVFEAFALPAHKRRWYAEGDHEIQEYELDFRVGGSERFRYAFKPGHPIAGSQIANESTYHDILPGKRIVFTQCMALNGKPIQIMLATLEFQPAGGGTTLTFTHQGTFIDWQGGVEMIEAGWRALFDRLAVHLAQ